MNEQEKNQEVVRKYLKERKRYHKHGLQALLDPEVEKVAEEYLDMKTMASVAEKFSKIYPTLMENLNSYKRLFEQAIQITDTDERLKFLKEAESALQRIIGIYAPMDKIHQRRLLEKLRPKRIKREKKAK